MCPLCPCPNCTSQRAKGNTPFVIKIMHAALCELAKTDEAFGFTSQIDRGFSTEELRAALQEVRGGSRITKDHRAYLRALGFRQQETSRDGYSIRLWRAPRGWSPSPLEDGSDLL